MSLPPSQPASPHTSLSTVGSGCCPRDERWRSGFLHAERRTGPTSRRLSPWWLYPLQSGPRPPEGGCAQLPSMCMKTHLRTKKVKMLVNELVHKTWIHVVHPQCEFAVWPSGYVFACSLYAETDLLSVCVGPCFSMPFIIETVTRGRGERSCATCRSATRGTVRRLGSTRWEAIASIIIVSDMALQNECRDDVGDAQRRDTQTNRQRLYTTADHMSMHRKTWYSGSRRQNRQEAPTG